MSMLFIVLPAAVLLASLAAAAFVWAVRQGQFDDLDTPPLRLLGDEDDDDLPGTPGTPG